MKYLIAFLISCSAATAQITINIPTSFSGSSLNLSLIQQNGASIEPPLSVGQIPGLIAWFRACDVTGTNGAMVNSWTSAVGKFVMTGTAVRSINSAGQVALRFNGLNQSMVLSGSSLPSSMNSAATILLVEEPRSTSFALPLAFGTGADLLFFTQNQTTAFQGLGSVAVYLSNYILNKPRTLAIAVGAGTYTLFQDGTKISQGACTLPLLSSLDLNIAKYSATFWSGDVSEVAIFDRALNESEMARLGDAFKFNRMPLSLSSPAFVAVGDSITLGVGVTPPDLTWYINISDMLGSTWNTMNFSYTGRRISDCLSHFEDEAGAFYDGHRSKNILTIGGGNDLIDVSVSTALQSLYEYGIKARARGYKVIAQTVTPRTTVGFNTDRNSYNETLRNEWPKYFDALADLAANETIGPDAAASDAGLYPDGIHPNGGANNIIAGIIYAAVKGVLAKQDRATESPLVISGTQTLTELSPQMQIFSGTAEATWILPPIVANAGMIFDIKNRGGGTVTLVRSGSDQIYTATTGTSVAITVGQSAKILNDGTYWDVFGPN